MKTDLEALERELKKRLDYPATPWDRRQNNAWDKETNFIYKTQTWEGLLGRVREFSRDKMNYAVNRWFNFWSAVGVEEIFCRQPGVTPGPHKHRLIDFAIGGITFDHKTTVFPAAYEPGPLYAAAYPRHLAWWLYEHQSDEGRRHFGNRLFVVLYDGEGKHWRLRAELGMIRERVEAYVRGFEPGRLIELHLAQDEQVTLTDVIWVPGSPLVGEPVTMKLDDWGDYLKKNGLRAVAASLRWEPDPDQPGRERAAVTVVCPHPNPLPEGEGAEAG